MLTAEEEELKRIWDLHSCLESARRRGYEKGEASGMKKGKESVTGRNPCLEQSLYVWLIQLLGWNKSCRQR